MVHGNLIMDKKEDISRKIGLLRVTVYLVLLLVIGLQYLSNVHGMIVLGILAAAFPVAVWERSLEKRYLGLRTAKEQYMFWKKDTFVNTSGNIFVISGVLIILYGYFFR